MPNIRVELTDEEMEALKRLAARKRRTPAMQAAHMIATECAARESYATRLIEEVASNMPKDWGEA